MTRAEPSIKVPGTTNRHTSQMSANSQHNQPLRREGTIIIRLLITQRREGNARLRGNFRGSSMTDEHRLSAPLDRDGLAEADGGHVEFRGGQGQYVGGGAHGRDEFHDEDAGRGSVRESDSGEQEVGEGATFGLGDSVDAVVGEAVVDGAELVEGGDLAGRLGLEGGEGGGGDVGGLSLECGEGGADSRGGGGSATAGEEVGGGPRGEAGG